MKNKSTLTLVISTGMLMCFLFSSNALAECESTKREYNTPAANDATEITTSIYQCETFIAESDHTIESVKMYFKKTNTGSDADINIYNADVNHKPTGEVLGTANWDLDDYTSEGIYEVAINIPFEITNTEEYLICAIGYGDGTNQIQMGDKTSDTYAGHPVRSDNSGSTWTVDWYNKDFIFEIWGCDIEEEEPATTTINATETSAGAITYLGMIIWFFMIIMIFLITFFIVLKA